MCGRDRVASVCVGGVKAAELPPQSKRSVFVCGRKGLAWAHSTSDHQLLPRLSGGATYDSAWGARAFTEQMLAKCPLPVGIRGSAPLGPGEGEVAGSRSPKPGSEQSPLELAGCPSLPSRHQPGDPRGRGWARRDFGCRRGRSGGRPKGRGLEAGAKPKLLGRPPFPSVP